MKRRAPAIIVLGTSLALLAVLVGGLIAGLRANLTPSYPLGLWRIEPLARYPAVGDRIFICPPPNPTFEVARKRGYLGHGLCPGRFSPLIKTVVAISGQHVVVEADIAVDGVHLAHSLVRGADGQGRALRPAASGAVPADQLFLFSEFAGSYDSRYFGPIPDEGLLGLAQPLMVFSP